MADMKMTPEDLQALRDQAEIVGLHDVQLGKFLQLLVPILAHAHGLDPLEEDERLRDEQEELAQGLRDKFKRVHGEVALTPAQEENKRQAEEQGVEYVAGRMGADETIDPVARATQEQGIGTVPTAQLEEALMNQPATISQPASNTSYADFSSNESAPNEDTHKPHEGHKHHEDKHHHGKRGK